MALPESLKCFPAVFWRGGVYIIKNKPLWQKGILKARNFQLFGNIKYFGIKTVYAQNIVYGRVCIV